LSNIFAPMLMKIGNSGNVKQAVLESSGFRNGVYVYDGILVNRLIASFFGLKADDIGLFLTGY